MCAQARAVLLLLCFGTAIDYASAAKHVREDGRCGPKFLAEDGSSGSCLDGCCSPAGWCGRSPQHCCDTCADHRSERTRREDDILARRSGHAVPEPPRPTADTAEDEVFTFSFGGDDEGSALVLVGDDGQAVGAFQRSHDEVFEDFQKSRVFTELHPSTVGAHLNKHLPFALFFLCRCHEDADVNVPKLSKLIEEKGLHQRFALMYVQPAVANRFHCYGTYGFSQSAGPRFVIDNIPIGQHVAKYVFPKSLARSEGGGNVRPEEIVRFLEDFYLDPTPLKLLVRSTPKPFPRPWEQRGVVWEVVGDTVQEVVYDSPYNVLLMLYKPSCPASTAAFPAYRDVARLLGDQSNVIVARMDRSQNDFPRVVHFPSYPTILLFTQEHKPDTAGQPLRYDHRARSQALGHANPSDVCGGTPDADDLVRFVLEHTSPLLEGNYKTGGSAESHAEQNSI